MVIQQSTGLTLVPKYKHFEEFLVAGQGSMKYNKHEMDMEWDFHMSRQAWKVALLKLVNSFSTAEGSRKLNRQMASRSNHGMISTHRRDIPTHSLRVCMPQESRRAYPWLPNLNIYIVNCLYRTSISNQCLEIPWQTPNGEIEPRRRRCPVVPEISLYGLTTRNFDRGTT